MSESNGDSDSFNRAILASVFLYVHLRYRMLANVKGQLLWRVIEANFPEVKSTFPADDSLSILREYCISQTIEHKCPLHKSHQRRADLLLWSSERYGNNAL